MDYSHSIQLDLGRELLKIIAIITMTIDHLGVVFYPQHLIFRVVGRLSFPLFSYLLVLGLESTRNQKKYLLIQNIVARLFFQDFEPLISCFFLRQNNKMRNCRLMPQMMQPDQENLMFYFQTI